jgi:hypothetical protein
VSDYSVGNRSTELPESQASAVRSSHIQTLREAPGAAISTRPYTWLAWETAAGETKGMPSLTILLSYCLLHIFTYLHFNQAMEFASVASRTSDL